MFCFALQLFLHPPLLFWWRTTWLSNSFLVRDYIIFKILLSLACSICPAKFYSIRLGSQWPMLTATLAGSRCLRIFPASFPSRFCLRAEQRRRLPPSPLNQSAFMWQGNFQWELGKKTLIFECKQDTPVCLPLEHLGSLGLLRASLCLPM